MVDLKKNSTVRIGLKYFTGILVYFLLVTLLISVEKESNQSALINYENAVWYSLVTLTTVGYGDIFPATLYGRAIGYVFILASLAFYGLIIGQFSILMTTLKENLKDRIRSVSIFKNSLPCL